MRSPFAKKASRTAKIVASTAVATGLLIRYVPGMWEEASLKAQNNDLKCKMDYSNPVCDPSGKPKFESDTKHGAFGSHLTDMQKLEKAYRRDQEAKMITPMSDILNYVVRPYNSFAQTLHIGKIEFEHPKSEAPAGAAPSPVPGKAPGAKIPKPAPLGTGRIIPA